jgi:DNA-binding LacI/PurR family transcriptional regulator
VWTVIERVGYVPDPLARGMVTRRTQVIGVVIPASWSAIFKDSAYFPTLLDGISETTYANDYGMLLWVGQPSEDEGLFHKRIAKNRLMDGLIIASATTTNQRTFIDQLLKLKTPFVMVERPVYRAEQVSYVTIDNFQASQAVVNHLISLGRRRIGTITGRMDNVDSQDRLRGYETALALAGLPNDLVVEGTFSNESGYLGMKSLLERGVDAVFAGTDLMAIGASQAIADAGLRIPDDIALVGFDDLRHAVEATPQLTTIRHPIHEKGALAARMLLDLIEGKTDSPQHILLPTELTIRKSCGAVKNLQPRSGEAQDYVLR